MKFVRVSTIVALAAAVITGSMLFNTSQKVQLAETRYRALRIEMKKEQEAIRVLKAEWDYLNRPDRLEALASEYLGMTEPDVKSVLADANDLPIPYPVVIPARKPESLMQQAVFQTPESAADPAAGMVGANIPASQPAMIRVAAQAPAAPVRARPARPASDEAFNPKSVRTREQADEHRAAQRSFQDLIETLNDGQETGQ